MSYYKNFKAVFDNPLWNLYLQWAYKKCIADLEKLGFQADFSKPDFTCLLCGVAQEKTADNFIKFVVKRNPKAKIWIIDIGEEQVRAVEELVKQKYLDINITIRKINALELDTIIPIATLDWIETDGFMQYFDSPSMQKLWSIWNQILKPDGFITIRDFSTTGSMMAVADKFRIWLVKVWLKAKIFRHTKEEFYGLFKQHGLLVTEGPTPLPTYKRFSLMKVRNYATGNLPVVWFKKLATSHALPQNRKYKIPILFIHGAWGGKYQFEKWIQFAAHEGYESYALDLRGHGESPCDDFQNTSLEDYAKDIETIARAVGPCYVVAHSLGGLALQLAASRCISIQKAVFVASAPAGVFGHSKYGIRIFSYIGDFLSWKPIAIKRNDALRFLFDYSSAYKKFDFTIRESPRAILDRGLGRVRVQSLLCPSLVVAAENDRAVPLSSEHAIARKYGSDYVQIPNIGHMLMMEEGWERPIREMLRWLEQ